MITTRSLRIGTLVVPSLLAGLLMLHVHHEQILDITMPVLAMLWIAMAGALVMRFIEGHARRGVRNEHRSRWDHVDVLTAHGASTLWLGALALIGSGVTGWASLSVVGVLGLGTTYLAVTWTALVGGGDSPWRGATISQVVLPEVSVEGDVLREEVRLVGVKIPAGLRLFATGRVHRHGAVSRYVVDSEASGGEVKLESDLGPGVRGVHRAPPLALWLGDVLGLTRTPIVYRGGATFSVLPREVVVTGVQRLSGKQGEDAISCPAVRLPTEGSFRIREYAAGDDTRRIHWVRSLQQDQLVVRLPDEIPIADPVVRLILDNELALGSTCRASDELLDALVRVWLGVGKALCHGGTRVTLVTAAENGGEVACVERNLVTSSREAARLGARVTWQASVSLHQLVHAEMGPVSPAFAREPRPGHAATKQLIVSSRPRAVRAPSVPRFSRHPEQPPRTSRSPSSRAEASELSWVIVPEVAWTTPQLWLPSSSSVTLPFPSGSEDNRSGRRSRERARIQADFDDLHVFGQVVCWSDWPRFSGQYLARLDGGRDGQIGLEVIR